MTSFERITGDGNTTQSQPPTGPLPQNLSVYKSGRKFLKDSKYILPFDGETDRLYLQHLSVRYLLCSNFNSPVDQGLQNGIKVLDAGCGSASWTMEMASDFPKSIFIGTDMVDIFPAPAAVPVNCSFVKANTLDGLPFADGTFDFVFQRFMVSTFTKEDWAKAISELVRVTKPGGWVELIEAEVGLHNGGPNSTKFVNSLAKAIESSGVDLSLVTNLGFLLTPHLNNVVSDRVSYPIGWKDRIGELILQEIALYYKGFKPFMIKWLECNDDEYEAITKQALVEYRETRSWSNYYYGYGQKAEH